MAYKPTKKEVKQSLDALAVLHGKMTVEEYRATQPPSERKQNTYPEAEAQMAVIAWCKLQGYPYNRLYAIENERKAISPQQAARRVKMGVKAGVSDLFLPIARGKYHGYFCEMKSPKGKLSEQQKLFAQEVMSEGYYACVCYNAQEAIDTIQKYINNNL